MNTETEYRWNRIEFVVRIIIISISFAIIIIGIGGWLDWYRIVIGIIIINVVAVVVTITTRYTTR